MGQRGSEACFICEKGRGETGAGGWDNEGRQGREEGRGRRLGSFAGVRSVGVRHVSHVLLSAPGAIVDSIIAGFSQEEARLRRGT